jgi:hypothetical protein
MYQIIFLKRKHLHQITKQQKQPHRGDCKTAKILFQTQYGQKPRGSCIFGTATKRSITQRLRHKR